MAAEEWVRESCVNFALLDFLNDSAKLPGFSLSHATTRRTRAQKPIDRVPCKRYCGFRGAAIAQKTITPQDCRLCRTYDVVSGTLSCESGETYRIENAAPQFARRVIASERGLNLVELDLHHDPRLTPFAASCPQATVFNYPEWMRALAEEYAQPSLVLAVEDKEGWLQAVLPMFYTRGLPFNIGNHQVGRRLSCLPRTPVAGPLSSHPTALELLLRCAVDHVCSEHGVQLQVKSAARLPATNGLIHTTWRPTYVLPLPEHVEQLRFGDAHSRHQLKWAVNKAMKQAVQVRAAESESDLERWYPMYLAVMRRNAALPRPYRFFLALWNHLRPVGMLDFQLAEQVCGASKRLVAGAIFLTAGQTVFYAFTGGRTEDLGLHPNDLLLWDALHRACRSGYRYFDFGEVAEEHPELVRFKTKWGAVPVPLHRYYCPELPVPEDEGLCGSSSEDVVPWQTVVNKVWTRLPLAATGKIADWAYSYL